MYQIIAGCLSELSELDPELEWCLERSWNSGLPERTPLCTAGCEGFLHLPPLSNSQQMPQYEPLLVLGIDLRALENEFGTNTIGALLLEQYYPSILQSLQSFREILKY